MAAYTLADIEQRTNVSVDRLRYVVDSRIMPGFRNRTEPIGASAGRGVPRLFTGFEAFGIVIAVLLLDAGVKRDTVRQCLDLLTDHPRGSRDLKKVILYQAFSQPQYSALEIGDRQNVRLKKSASGAATASEQPWIQVATRATVVGYQPLVAIAIDVQKLRSRLPD